MSDKAALKDVCKSKVAMHVTRSSTSKVNKNQPTWLSHRLKGMTKNLIAYAILFFLSQSLKSLKSLEFLNYPQTAPQIGNSSTISDKR